MAKFVGILVLCMVIAPMVTEAAISCGQVGSSMASCINYLRGAGPLPQSCCNGIRSLNNAAKTTPDRQAACKCLKSAAGAIPGLRNNLAEGLPSRCGVNISYKISMSTNCNTVK